MTLQIKFPKRPPVKKRMPEIPSEGGSLGVWRKQKPRMSSCRIMIEVRRRLWIQVCAPETDVILQNKLLHRIERLSKRIERRVVEESLQAPQVKALHRLFDGAYAGDQAPTMGMSY